MMNRMNDVAVVGLGVMGANLARNLARHGWKVAGYDQSTPNARNVAAQFPEASLDIATTLEELLRRLSRPRRIILLVPAGAPVDAVIRLMEPLMDPGDVVIDAGNSHFADTDRRDAQASRQPWHFVGMGISGGAQGALEGPAMMPGGDPDAWELIRPMCESIAAAGPSGPCVAYCGRSSAGHFVKMVHNGIEYGDMQLIAEASVLLQRGLRLEPARIADILTLWNEGELESYLVEITSHIFRFEDPEHPGKLLLDAILDRAGQKGTGRWTVSAALDLAVPIPTIAAAVDARLMSGPVGLRRQAEALFADPRTDRQGLLDEVTPEDIRAALYASKIASYTQGFALLEQASEHYAYRTNLAEVARTWTAGCIIRAKLLERIRQAFSSPDSLSAPPLATTLLALTPEFSEEIRERLPSWRKVVSAAARAGFAVPGLGASLTWFDSLSTGRGSAHVIQAQRDFFGSHTYERLDNPGVAVHTEWT